MQLLRVFQLSDEEHREHLLSLNECLASRQNVVAAVSDRVSEHREQTQRDDSGTKAKSCIPSCCFESQALISGYERWRHQRGGVY